MSGTPTNSMNLNATVAGIVNWDGVKVMSVTPLSQYSTLVAASNKTIANISPGTAGYVLTSNGASANPSYQAVPSGGGGITTIDGDSGSITGSTVSITANTTAGSTVNFINSGTLSTLNVSDTDHNTMIGAHSGLGTGASDNTCVGDYNGTNFTSGVTQNACCGYGGTYAFTTASYNSIIGSNCFGNLQTGNYNTACGNQIAPSLVTGSNNFFGGYFSGNNYTGSESSNILLSHDGITGESNVMRLGKTGSGPSNVNECFIAGVNGASAVAGAVPNIDSSDQLVATTLNVDASGIMTNASQPAFLAYLPSADTNATGDGTAYTLGATTPLTTIYDRGSNFNASTGVFTAPKTGVYMFTAGYAITNIGAAHTRLLFYSPATSRQATVSSVNPFVMASSNGYVIVCSAFYLDMTAGDTASMVITVYNSTKTITVFGDSSLNTFFGGSLIC